MAKKSKLTTPAWILEGYDSEEEYNKEKGISNSSLKKELKKAKKEKNKEKNFVIKICPKCGSEEVGVVLKEQGKADEWECRKCGWKGKDIQEKELSEDEFINYMENKK